MKLKSYKTAITSYKRKAVDNEQVTYSHQTQFVETAFGPGGGSHNQIVSRKVGSSSYKEVALNIF